MGVQRLVAERFRCMWENGGLDYYFHVFSYVYVQLFWHVFVPPSMSKSRESGISDPKGITETRPWPGQWWDLCAHDTGPFKTTIRLVLSCAAEWVEGRNRSAMCICTHRCRKWMNLNEKLWVRNMWKRQVTSPSSLGPPYPQLCSMKRWLSCSKTFRVSLQCKFVENWQQRNVGGTENYLML